MKNLLNTREEVICSYANDKSVLDIGSVGQSQPGRLFSILDKVSKSLIGIDTEGPAPDSRIIIGNAETYSFNKKFDLIVAGDVIEHVSNPGQLLDNCLKHLYADGYLILTTPNAKWINVLFKPNSTHVLWHDRYTLETLIKRHGFITDYFTFYNGNKPYYNILKRVLTMKQAMLFVLKVDDSNSQ